MCISDDYSVVRGLISSSPKVESLYVRSSLETVSWFNKSRTLLPEAIGCLAMRNR